MYAKYWERIWIVQEYVLANRVIIHLGLESLDGAVLDGAINGIQDLDIKGRLVKKRSPAEKMSHHQLAEIRMKQIQDRSKSISVRDRTMANLLSFYCNSKATD